MLISFLTYIKLLVSFYLISYVQSVTSLLTTVNNHIEVMKNQQSSILAKNTFEKHKRAYKSLEFFLVNEITKFGKNLLPEQTKELICQTDFRELKGVLYSFFDKNNIFISISPYDIDVSKKDKKCKWKYYINIDGTEITEGEFDKRDYAEFVCFQKAFQFLDTQLFITDTKNRFYDESADSSCLNVNWKHLNKVLSHKRKLIL